MLSELTRPQANTRQDRDVGDSRTGQDAAVSQTTGATAPRSAVAAHSIVADGV
jgi:hypothetical protein